MILIALKKIPIILFMAVLTTILNPLPIEACPGCNSALSSSVGHGFNTSILFLLAMPFLVLGVTAVGIIFVHRGKQTNSYSKSHKKDNETKERQN